jgi:tetratricopeptide (TPR) repeat protein
LGNLPAMGITLANIGNVFSDRRQWNAAKAYYLEAIGLLEPNGEVYGLAMLYGNLAFVLREEGYPDQAVWYYERSIFELRRLGPSAELARFLNSLGRTQALQGQHDKALRSSQEALSISEQLQDELGMAAAWYHLAGLYEKTGNIEEATRLMTRVVSIDERFGLPKLEENRRRLEKLKRLQTEAS